MTLYIIRSERVTARASSPTTIAEGAVMVRSAKDIEASALSKAQLAAIWNALPGAASLTKFKDRKVAAQRLWTAFTQLPLEPEPMAVSAGPRAGTKQVQVIGLLERPEGATVSEVSTFSTCGGSDVCFPLNRPRR